MSLYQVTRSKYHRLAPEAEVTFCLTTGGHNAGIVCGPVHPRRSHEIRTREPGAENLSTEEWKEAAEQRDGSWWPSWEAWLSENRPNYDSADMSFCGRRGFNHFRHRVNVVHDYEEATAKPSFDQALRIAGDLSEQFLQGAYDILGPTDLI